MKLNFLFTGVKGGEIWMIKGEWYIPVMELS